MLVLGIESSCDETGAAVVRLDDDGTGEILSNVVRSQWQAHQRYGGVVPEIAARAHVEVADSLVQLAMGEAGIGFDALDGVAATAGPGLIGGLLVGMMTAKSVALVHDLPFVGVNHLEGHALTIWLTDGLAPPYLLLLVSGGHTQLLIVHGVGRYERLGTTLDDALGEAFDKTAKLLGLGYPGGPHVERLAQKGDGNRFALPRPLKGRAEPHFSFAGLKTAVRQAAQKLAPLSDQDVSDICASFQAAVIDTVCDRVSRAMEIYVQRFPDGAGRRLVIAGGVAANRALSEGLAARISAQGFSRHVAPAALCTDNAAMIAWAGALRFAAGQRDTLDLKTRARWPLDASAPLATGAGIKA